MTARKDFNLAAYAGGSTLSYSADFWDTVRGAWADAFKMDYTGWANVPTGARRVSLPAAGEMALYQRNGAGTDDAVFDSRSKASLAGADFTGPVSVAGKAYTPSQAPAYAGALVIDAALGNVFEVGALTGNVASMAISNWSVGQTINLRFVQDATGGRTVAVPAGAVVAGAVNPTASKVSWLVLTKVDNAGAPRGEGAWMQLP